VSGGYYRMTIVSFRFAAKTTMARHRLVYDVPGSLMHHEIYALSITAKTQKEI
jgi:BolA protein